MAHPSFSAYGSFLTHSARAGYNSGTPASGRLDTFGAPLGNDRCLRTAGDWNRRIVFSNTAAKPRI
jgi:hypothetical protein